MGRHESIISAMNNSIWKYLGIKSKEFIKRFGKSPDYYSSDMHEFIHPYYQVMELPDSLPTDIRNQIDALSVWIRCLHLQYFAKAEMSFSNKKQAYDMFIRMLELSQSPKWDRKQRNKHALLMVTERNLGILVATMKATTYSVWYFWNEMCKRWPILLPAIHRSCGKEGARLAQRLIPSFDTEVLVNSLLYVTEMDLAYCATVFDHFASVHTMAELID
jgi:hypothetical protein